MRVTEQGQIVWSDRLPKMMIQKIYDNDASGLIDEELLDQAGAMLYARCTDILYIRDFISGDYRCPRCEHTEGHGSSMKARGETHVCPVCGFTRSKEDFHDSFRKRQLNPGGAVPAFEKFRTDWQKASTAQRKMLAIDAVIHSFHYSLKNLPDVPTRAAGVNLIEGRLTDVVAFLDALSANSEFHAELHKNRALVDLWKNQPS